MFLKKDNPKSKSKKTKKAKPTSLEKKQSKLSSRVTSVFKSAGFAYLKTGDIHKFFGGQKGEIDHIFLYKNVVIFMEETAGKALDTDHLKKKHYYHEKLTEHHTEVIDWLKKDFPEAFASFDEFEYSEYRTFYAYASEFIIGDDTKSNFSNLVFIDGPILDYFVGLVDTIKRTAKYEIFKFFGLALADIGNASSSASNSTIDTASVIPQSSSGFPEGVKVVTFAMNANELMECSYVLRKDGWDQSGGMYQRILDKKKIERIRKYLSEKKRTFIDSIIVSLPFETTFFTGPKGNQQQVDVFKNVTHSNITVSLPREINSIGIIDGQHRVFSHYEGNDAGEGSIRSLRDKRHLLVTGLFFDKTRYPEQDKRKLESEIFLQINSRQTNVNKGLLQYIESLIDPYSAVGIATRVVQLLNKRKPFLGMFALSQHDKAGIKVPSLSQYALQSLVQISETDTSSLFSYWYKEANADVRSSDKAYQDYIEFCVSKIAIYFSAVKSVKQEDWTLDTKQSRLLSVTPVVGFLIAFRRSLSIFEGPQDFDFYKPKLEKLTVDFKVSKDHPFIYTSSQWGALADVIESECWKK